MGRPRIHATAAERQRAYRARQGAPAVSMTPQVGRCRQASRPARLAALDASLRSLLEEYQGWLDTQPESLEGSAQDERLKETVEQLEAALDILSEVEPPRGYGRDR